MSNPRTTDPYKAAMAKSPTLRYTPDGKGGYKASRRLESGGGRGKPRTQYYGGSYEEYLAARGEAALDAEESRLGQSRARKGLTMVAGEEAGKLEGIVGTSGQYAANQRAQAAQATGLVMRGASDLERLGARAAKDYKQTSDAQFRNQQDANQRAALSIGAVGGASGVRSALAASSQANAQAANQAAIIQAQELNNIRQQQQNAVAQAAGLRGGVAQLGTQAALMAAQQQMTGQQAASGIVAGAAGAESQAAQQQYQFESQREFDIEVAQLNARREREAQYQNWHSNRVKRATGGLLG